MCPQYISPCILIIWPQLSYQVYTIFILSSVMCSVLFFCIAICRYSSVLTDSFAIKAIHAWTWPEAQPRADTIDDRSTWAQQLNIHSIHWWGTTTVYYRWWRWFTIGSEDVQLCSVYSSVQLTVDLCPKVYFITYEPPAHYTKWKHTADYMQCVNAHNLNPFNFRIQHCNMHLIYFDCNIVCSKLL